jgi:transposase
MIFLDATAAEKLEPIEARLEALRYSNLCKSNFVMIAKLEQLNGALASALGKEHQAVLDAQVSLDAMKGRLFGKSSERRADTDGPLFAQAEAALEEMTKPRKKKREDFGRTPQPELPRTIIPHALTEEEMKAQGLRPMIGQFEVSELINVTPSRFVVEEHRRQKYAPIDLDAVKEDAPVIVTAPGPLRLKECGRYSPAFGVECGIGKFQWHLPLDRQVRIMKAGGLVCTSQVLFAQLDTIAWHLGIHVMPGIIAKIKSHRVNQGDETYLENLAKDAKSRFWLWSVMNPEAILFDVYDSRSKRAAQDFLKDLEGVLLTDGYVVYQSLASLKLMLANDWAHVRRKFVGAETTHPIESKWFIERIRALFEIEERIKGKCSMEILGIRQLESKPIVDAIEAKCRILLETTLPKSPLGRAIRYTLKLWKGLSVFLDNADVPLDTNWIERMQRSPVVGRKNYCGMKTLVNAKMAAIWHSVIQTCILNGIEPREYINETIRAILSKERVVMPWDWPKKSGTKPVEEAVSKTVVCETSPGLTTKSAENAAIAASKAVS